MLITDQSEHTFHLYRNCNNMVDVTTGSKGGKWVCPNDRQLALRAKLSTGWSVKTQDLKEYGRKSQSLSEMEQNAIKQVIQRAEILEQREQERVGRLVDRLDNMKRNVMGNGTTQCILCGDTFRMFGTSNFLCFGCKKLVCDKCGIEILSSNQEPIWLCKICSETREMWKKSGAWFFKGLPKYKLPDKKSEKYGLRKITRPGMDKNNWSRSNSDLPDASDKAEPPEEDDAREKAENKANPRKGPRSSDELSQTTWTGVLGTPSDKNAQGTLSSASGNSFYQTSSDSGMEESDKSARPDKRQCPKEKYRRDVSGDSSESNSSSFSRQTSSTFSESQQNLTSHNLCLSSVNQSSCCRLPLNSEKNKSDTATSTGDKSPASNQSSLKCPEVFEKSVVHSKLTQDDDNSSVLLNNYREFVGKKSYFSSSGKIGSPFSKSTGDQDCPKHRKKVSIDFGKTTSFLRYPLKHDKKKEKNKLSKFSSSESHLESSTDSGSGLLSGNPESSFEYFSESDRSSGWTETQSVLGANHWLSQESSIHTFDSLSDLNIQNKWSRRESMTSLSRDYWPEDQLSLSSFAAVNQDITESVGGKNAQLGLLEISLWYDPARAALHCTLHRGKGLKATDINGLADPFCKLNILPTNGKSNRLKTKTVHKSVNPEFNETVNFYGISETDVQKKTLHILVLDDDKYGNDFLGEARIPLFKVGAKQTKHVSVFLEKHYQVNEESEVWGEDTWNRGKILVTLCYSTKKRALIVFIGRCTNLLPMDNNGLSDPFVKLHLTPDPNHKKHKTSVKWKNLNPIFNEEFVFETRMTDLPKQTLILTVWDKDYGKSNDYLGGLELGWRSKGERLKHWIDVIKFPDHKHEGWHQLGEELITD